MTTIVDAMCTAINTNWGFDAGGGTEPTYIIDTTEYRSPVPVWYASEYIAVAEMEPVQRDPLNDNYVNITYTLGIEVSTPTSDDRLKELVDEVRAIVNTYALTGVNVQYVAGEDDITERWRPRFVCLITVKCIAVAAASAVAFSSYTLESQYGFKTITGITNDVVADSAADTLTLASANNRLTIVGTSATDLITFTLVEANIDHDVLTNFVANEHINHTSVTLTAGAGLTGGGDISANRTFALSHLGIQSLADPNADRIMFWDDTVGAMAWLVPNTGLAIDGANLNCSITQYTDALARAACLEDTAYGAGWNGDTTHAPTQNAVYDYVSTLALDSIVLKKDASVALTANWDVGAFTLTGTRFISDIAIGTSPFACTSTTVCSNLNADKVDGSDAADFATVAHLHDTQTLQCDGIASNGGAFAFTTTGTITMASALVVEGLLTADSIVPEADKADSLGNALLTWANIYVDNIYDDDGTKCAHTLSDGKFYIDNTLVLTNGVTEFSTDSTLGDNSDLALPTEKATKTYIDNAIPDYWQMVYTDSNGTVSGSGGVSAIALDENEYANFNLVVPRTGTIAIVMQIATDTNVNVACSITTVYTLGTPEYDHAAAWDGSNTDAVNIGTATDYYYFSRHTSISVTAGQLLSVRVQNKEASFALLLAGIHIVYS